MKGSNLGIKCLVLIIIIFFLDFFSFTKIPEDSMLISAGVFGLGILLFITATGTILFKNNLILYPLDQLVILYITAIFLSFLTAYVYWNQPLGSSLLSYRLFYIFFLYFVLMYFELSKKDTEDIIKILFFSTLLIFIIDYLSFPDPLFSIRSEERRSGITIFFNGQGFAYLGGFYYLNKFFKNLNPWNLILFSVAAFFLFFLTQSRMNLIGLVLGFITLLLGSKLRYKHFWAFLIIASGIIIYLTSDILKAIKEENSQQAEFYSDDIRVQAQEFFLTELQGGWPTSIFGNGYPAQSSKLEEITNYGKDNGYYTSDVGLTAIYSFFGIIGVVVWIIIFYIAFFSKIRFRFYYIKAYFLTVFLTAATGYSLYDPGYMPSTVIALYLLKKTKYLKESDPSLHCNTNMVANDS